MNMLTEVGFTSLHEVLTPVIPGVAAFSDHITLVGWRGLDEPAWTARWPERLFRIAHPKQGLRFRLRNGLAARRGGGLPSVFTKSRR
jgi:hypothetical protein